MSKGTTFKKGRKDEFNGISCVKVGKGFGEK